MAEEADFSVPFVKPWEYCPNCKQQYQRQLSLDMSSSFVTFAEATYGHPENSKWDKIRVMQSLRSKIVTLVNNIFRPLSCQDAGMLKMECETLIKKLLSMVEQIKKDEKMDGWVHMPHTSIEYKFSNIIGYFEAFGYECFGTIMALDETEESDEIAIKHFEVARILYNIFGMKELSKEMESRIADITTRSAWSNEDEANVCATTLLQNARINYETCLASSEMTSIMTINSGLHYARMLRKANRGIEAERLLMKLATGSRRVHGPEHNCTTSIEDLLKKSKLRLCLLLPDGKPCQALRYENDGEICVLTGPITEPREMDDERMVRVTSDLIQPILGCPVICHGLVSASHLNGKVGDVRASHKNGGLAVHFEDKRQKPALVKPENLRIAFELPTEGSSCLENASSSVYAPLDYIREGGRFGGFAIDFNIFVVVIVFIVAVLLSIPNDEL
ncbi:hypothetical protein ACHAW5_001016 [Stephanodiscus triporus]|uniref:Uncharacterized protein n=1 Tax=Stephanodiscus triporus TaxID=2934178 RepID=A0ABD3PL93_9STRA